MIIEDLFGIAEAQASILKGTRFFRNIFLMKLLGFIFILHAIGYMRSGKNVILFRIFIYAVPNICQDQNEFHNQIFILGFNQENARKTENSPKYMNDCVRSLTNIAEHELDAAEQQQGRKINLVEFILKSGLPNKMED